MVERVAREDMEFLLKVLDATILDLLEKFKDSSGWSISSMNYETVELSEMGKRYSSYVPRSFTLEAK